MFCKTFLHKIAFTLFYWDSVQRWDQQQWAVGWNTTQMYNIVNKVNLSEINWWHLYVLGPIQMNIKILLNYLTVFNII